MIKTKKKPYYVRSGGQTVGVYAESRMIAKEKLMKLNYKIESAVVSIDEWCR